MLHHFVKNRGRRTHCDLRFNPACGSHGLSVQLLFGQQRDSGIGRPSLSREAWPLTAAQGPRGERVLRRSIGGGAWIGALSVPRCHQYPILRPGVVPPTTCAPGIGESGSSGRPVDPIYGPPLTELESYSKGDQPEDWRAPTRELAANIGGSTCGWTSSRSTAVDASLLGPFQCFLKVPSPDRSGPQEDSTTPGCGSCPT